MKNLLIAAGMAAAMFVAAPALAAPVAPSGNGIALSAPQDGRMESRDDRRMDRRDDRRGDRRGWRNNDRRYGWNNRRCHNERRHHRWVRVCGRR